MTIPKERLTENTNRVWLWNKGIRPISRWHNIPREERIYHLCKETIGDEYHFLFVCKNENIITLRNKYLPNYYRVYPNHAKFEGLLSICNTELYKRLSIFIRKAAALLWVYVTACIMF